MTDIVERLREHSAGFAKDGLTRLSVDMADAAEEIERLRRLGGKHILDASRQLNEQEAKIEDLARKVVREAQRADDAEAEAEVLRIVLPRLIEIAEEHCDRGPPGEGWQSDELKALIGRAGAVLLLRKEAEG